MESCLAYMYLRMKAMKMILLEMEVVFTCMQRILKKKNLFWEDWRFLTWNRSLITAPNVAKHKLIKFHHHTVGGVLHKIEYTNIEIVVEGYVIFFRRPFGFGLGRFGTA